MKINYKNPTSLHVTLDDCTGWTLPTRHSDGSAAWRLTHTEWRPNKEERLQIASMLEVLSELIDMPLNHAREYLKQFKQVDRS